MSSLLVNTPRGNSDADNSANRSAALADSRVEQLVKRLEEACVRVSGDESISAMRRDPTSAVYVPLRVKEIVQDCLTHTPIRSRRSIGDQGEEGGGRREVLRYVEMWREGKEGSGGGGGGSSVVVRAGERGKGERELEGVRELLTAAQRQNEELSLKYIAVSEKVEEIFRLQAEVSALTFQTDSLREDNSELQQTLLDQETSFSYALRNCHAERMEREQRVGRVEEQVKQYQSRCSDLEAQLRAKYASTEEEHSQLASSIRRLQQELERVKMQGEERFGKVEREGREDVQRVRREAEKELERVKREGKEEMERVKREGREEVVRVRREGEVLEKTHHQELRAAVERAEEEEQKVSELSLINEQLQQQLVESEVAGTRLTEDVHQLSLTLSQTQTRLRDVETQQQESFISAQEESVRYQKTSLSLALRDVASLQRELALLTQAVHSDLYSGGREVSHTTQSLRTLLNQMSASHSTEMRHLTDSLQRQQEDTERSLRQELSQVEESARQTSTQLQTDLQTHITAHREILAELESTKEATQQLTSEKQSLQTELENSNRCLLESEAERSNVASQLEEVQSGRVTLEREQLQLQQQLHTLREEIKQMEEMSTSKQLELTRQQEQVRQLQTQLDSASRESESLRLQLAQLRTDHETIAAENSENMCRLGALEEEKEQLHRELSSSQEEVSVLRGSLAEVEEEKGRVLEELQRAQREVEIVTQRNAEMTQLRDSQGDAMEELKQKNAHLMREVNQLSLSLKEAQYHQEDALNERDRLVKETASLTESLSQYKRALEEVRQQRSSLNTTVTTTAQEKADLVREKVSLRVQVENLEDALGSLKKRLSLASIERERLEQKAKDSEKRLFLAELNRSIVSREGSMISISSTDMKRSLSGLLPQAREDQQEATCEKILEEYEPLYTTLTQMKKRLVELEGELKACQLRHESQLNTVQEAHARAISSIRKQHEAAQTTWRAETESVRRNLRERQQKMQAQLREAQVEAQRKNQVEREGEHTKWQGELTALQNELRSERQKNADSERKLFQSAQIRAENSRLTEQLRSSQLQLEEVQREMKSLHENNRLLQNTRGELAAAVDKAEAASRAMQQSLTSRAVDLEIHEQQLRELEAERERLSMSQQQTLEQSRKDSRTLIEMETQLAELQGSNHELKKERERMESALLAAQRDNMSLESQLLAVKTEMSSATAKLESSQLKHSEVERNYSQLLDVLNQVLEFESDNPLHTVETATLPLSTAKPPVRKAEVFHQAILQLKRELALSRETAAQHAEKVEQYRRELEHAAEEKAASETHIQTLTSSLTSLQASVDSISGQCDMAEASSKEAKNSVRELQTEKKEFQQQNRSLQRQLESMRESEESFEIKHRNLEQKMRELEMAKKAHSEEVLQLKNIVSMLKSSQSIKDRKLAELEEKLQSKQMEMLEREVTFKTTERTKGMLEQQLAGFDQASATQERVKKELQTRVKFLKSQLTEIQDKTQSLRRDMARVQNDNKSLSEEVERLSQCLKTTTQEKQMLSQSLEREIDRLRAEVERHLYENSSLRVQLVHSGSQPSMDTSSVDELISTSRTQLQSVQASESGGAEVWKEQCYKYRTAVQQLERKVRHMERKMLSTRLGTHTSGESTPHLDEATSHLLHQLHVTAATRSDEELPLRETMSPPSCSSTPRKLSTSS